MKEKPKSRISINDRLKDKAKDISKQAQASANQFTHLMKWAAAISQHPYSYRPVDHSLTTHHYFQIQLMQVSGLQVLLGKRKQYLQINCIIYNKQSQSFVSSTYSSQMFQIEAKGIDKPFCQCDKSIFFYTPLQDIALKVDIWRLQSQKNSKGIENMSKRIYIGHFQVGLGETRESGVVEKQLSNNQLLRFGSMSEADEIESEQGIELTKKASKVVYRVINTDNLSHLHHFVPHNHIFDEHNTILGLKNRRIGSKGQIEMGERSRLTFQIKSLTLPTATVKYLTELTEQKVSSAFTVAGRPTVNIKQMRLNFEFHNGWKSVSYESLLLKQTITQSAILQTNRSLAPNKNQSKIIKGKEPLVKTKTFWYDKAKELKAVFKGQNGILILWIQAKIEAKFEIVEEKVKSRTELFWIPLAFALKPLPQSQEEQIFSLELASGNPYNLPSLIAYLTELKNSKGSKESSDKIICSMSVLLQGSVGTIENIETVEKEMNDIQNLKMEKQRLLRLKRKLREEKRKKLIELNQEIPFLDTIQLKEQLYEQQIGRIKSEKQEQQHIILYLKDRINQLERQAFKNQLNFQQHSDQEDLQANTIKVQKLPNHFVDYRPELTTQTIQPAITLNYFSRNYHKLCQSPSKIVSKRFIQECISRDTYIQFKITHFQVYFSQMQTFKFIIPDCQASQKALSITQYEYQNQTIEMKINFTADKTQQIMNHLLNGYLQIYLQCNGNKHLRPFALITLSELINQCSNQGDLLYSIDKTVLFQMQSTFVAYMELAIAFTNTCNIASPPQSKTAQHQTHYYDKPQPSNIMNRIKRFKQNNGTEDSKLQAINQIIQQSKVNTINIFTKQHIRQQFDINVSNKSSQREVFVAYIFDQDSRFLEQQQISLLLLSKKNQYRFEIQGNGSQKINLMYLSERANMNTDMLARENKNNMHKVYRHYNHEHKITVNIAKSKTNLIVERYQIFIHPQCNQNILLINQYIFEESYYSLPLQTNHLQVIATPDITLTNTAINIKVPIVQDDVYISQFSLEKPQKDKSITFQSFEFYGWKCDKIEVMGKLWQTKDVLLKIPIQIILNKQIDLPYLIEEITIVSKHINVRIRHLGQFAYESQLKINRKNSQVLIRAEVSINEIGKYTYGVQIADKNKNVFHRLGLALQIEYPILSPHQIISIKVPKESLGNLQPFSYQNKQQVGLQHHLKSNMPHLLAFKQPMAFLKIGQEWIIEMMFRWERIVAEMREQQKEEVSILVGIVCDLAIEYILFRCKLN